MKINCLALAASTALLAGCTQYEVVETGVAVPEGQLQPYATWPDELEGRVVRIETDGGTVNRINFGPGGTMNILVDPGGPVVRGVYGFRDADTLCVNFAPRGEECWPYEPYMVGEAQTIVSNRGQTLRVTMLER